MRCLKLDVVCNLHLISSRLNVSFVFELPQYPFESVLPVDNAFGCRVVVFPLYLIPSLVSRLGTALLVFYRDSVLYSSHVLKASKNLFLFF